MDFFTSQAAAQRKTKRLVFFFGLAVAAIICAVYAVVMGLFAYGASTTTSSLEGQPAVFWQPDVFMGVATAILIIVSIGSLFKMAALKSGGASVAQMMGGALVRPDTTEFYERRLLNIVEEMAVASGLPIPPVYLMQNEESINAFAAGFRPEDAVVGVTRGCLLLLDREELQGVIAHEFSHILNGDMRLNIRLMGVLHGILAAMDGGEPADWVAAPRWHHQYLPDQILFEPDALTPSEQEALRAKGHGLEATGDTYGNMQLIQWDKAADRVRAASDPRGIGSARVLQGP